jgi:hypothetical protein
LYTTSRKASSVRLITQFPNCFWWDLRGEPADNPNSVAHGASVCPHVAPGPQGWRAAPGPIAGRISPLAAPGNAVKLTVNDQEFTQKLNVLKDPYSAGSESDIGEEMKLLIALRDDLETVSEAVNQIELLRSHLVSLDRGLGNAETTRPVGLRCL